MAGFINNTTLLSAANQTVAAINDTDNRSQIAALDTRLATIAAQLNCLCNAVRDLAWTNSPIEFPDPPDTIILPPPPDGEPPTPGWSACAAAYAMIEALAVKFDELADLAGTPLWAFLGVVGVLGGLAVLVGTGQVITVGVLAGFALAANLWASLGVLLEYGLDGVLANIAHTLRTNAQLRNCMGFAFVTGNGAEDKAALIRQAVSAKMENPAFAAVVNSLIDTNLVAIFAYGAEVDGEMVFPQHPAPGGCNCVTPCVDEITHECFTFLGYQVTDIQSYIYSSGECTNNSMIEHAFSSGFFDFEFRVSQLNPCWELYANITFTTNEPQNITGWLVTLEVIEGSELIFQGVTIPPGVQKKLAWLVNWNHSSCAESAGYTFVPQTITPQASISIGVRGHPGSSFPNVRRLRGKVCALVSG